jgi:hypothetical protein
MHHEKNNYQLCVPKIKMMHMVIKELVIDIPTCSIIRCHKFETMNMLIDELVTYLTQIMSS